MAQTAAVAKKAEEKIIEYIPFGADEKVTLTLRLVRDCIAKPTKSGVKPTLADCYHFAMLCKARALNPWEGDCYMLGYDSKDGPTFSLITAHQAFLKRAELHPDYNGMESGIVVRDSSGAVHEAPGEIVLPDFILIGGWAKVYSKDKEHHVYRRLDITKYKKPFGIWLNNPAMMIVKCAEADALRSAYPTKLGGLYLREEMANIDRGEQTALPAPEAEGGVKVDIEPEPTATENLAAKVQRASDVEIINELGGTGEEVAGPTPDEKGLLERIEKITNGFELRAWKKKHQADISILSPAKQKKIEAALRKKQEELSRSSPELKQGQPDPLWGMILQMSNGDETQALKVLSRYMKKAGRSALTPLDWRTTTEADRNCLRPYVEEDFNAQNGIAEPRMGLGGE